MNSRLTPPSPILLIALCAISVLLAGASYGAEDSNTLLNKIFPPQTAPQTGAQLGMSVAIDGDFIVVGVPYDNVGGVSSGTAKVFDRLTGAVQVIPNPSADAGDCFGYDVAISGTLVAVGAPYDDTDNHDAGRVYVFDLSPGGPSLRVKP